MADRIGVIAYARCLEPICEIGGELMGPDEGQLDEPS